MAAAAKKYRQKYGTGNASGDGWESLAYDGERGTRTMRFRGCGQRGVLSAASFSTTGGREREREREGVARSFMSARRNKGAKSDKGHNAYLDSTRSSGCRRLSYGTVSVQSRTPRHFFSRGFSREFFLFGIIILFRNCSLFSRAPSLCLDARACRSRRSLRT